MIYIVLIICILALCAIMLWFKELYVRNGRNKDSKEEFLRFFAEKGVPELFSRAVFHSLQDGMLTRDFPVGPHDKLYEVYGIAGSDLDDLVQELAELSGYDLLQSLDYWTGPIVTVEDLIMFVSSFPEKDKD